MDSNHSGHLKRRATNGPPCDSPPHKVSRTDTASHRPGDISTPPSEQDRRSDELSHSRRASVSSTSSLLGQKRPHISANVLQRCTALIDASTERHGARQRLECARDDCRMVENKYADFPALREQKESARNVAQVKFKKIDRVYHDSFDEAAQQFDDFLESRVKDLVTQLNLPRPLSGPNGDVIALQKENGKLRHDLDIQSEAVRNLTNSMIALSQKVQSHHSTHDSDIESLEVQIGKDREVVDAGLKSGFDSIKVQFKEAEKIDDDFRREISDQVQSLRQERHGSSVTADEHKLQAQAIETMTASIASVQQKLDDLASHDKIMASKDASSDRIKEQLEIMQASFDERVRTLKADTEKQIDQAKVEIGTLFQDRMNTLATKDEFEKIQIYTGDRDMIYADEVDSLRGQIETLKQNANHGGMPATLRDGDDQKQFDLIKSEVEALTKSQREMQDSMNAFELETRRTISRTPTQPHTEAIQSIQQRLDVLHRVTDGLQNELNGYRRAIELRSQPTPPAPQPTPPARTIPANSNLQAGINRQNTPMQHRNVAEFPNQVMQSYGQMPPGRITNAVANQANASPGLNGRLTNIAPPTAQPTTAILHTALESRFIRAETAIHNNLLHLDAAIKSLREVNNIARAAKLEFDNLPTHLNALETMLREGDRKSKQEIKQETAATLLTMQENMNGAINRAIQELKQEMERSLRSTKRDILLNRTVPTAENSRQDMENDLKLLKHDILQQVVSLDNFESVKATCERLEGDLHRLQKDVLKPANDELRAELDTIHEQITRFDKNTQTQGSQLKGQESRTKGLDESLKSQQAELKQLELRVSGLDGITQLHGIQHKKLDGKVADLKVPELIKEVQSTFDEHAKVIVETQNLLGVHTGTIKTAVHTIQDRLSMARTEWEPTLADSTAEVRRKEAEDAAGGTATG